MLSPFARWVIHLVCYSRCVRVLCRTICQGRIWWQQSHLSPCLFVHCTVSETFTLLALLISDQLLTLVPIIQPLKAYCTVIPLLCSKSHHPKYVPWICGHTSLSLPSLCLSICKIFVVFISVVLPLVCCSQE